MLGRAAWRWSRFTRDHAVARRLIVRPWAAAVEIATLRRPWWLREHPLFDRAWYRSTYTDVGAGRLPAWWHYVRHGAREGRLPNRWLDPQWYLRAYTDVASGGTAPIDHYHRHGWLEGRNPGPSFDTRAYLARHPGVAAAGIDPLVHAVRGASALPLAREDADPAPADVAAPTVDAEGTAPARTESTGRRKARAATTVDRKALRRLLAAAPEGARVGVIASGWGDPMTLGAPGQHVRRIGGDGTLGDLPGSLLGARAHLEVLRARDIDALLLPADAPWVTALPGLLPALRERYAVLATEPAGTLLDLRVPLPVSDERGAPDLAAVVTAVRDRLGRDPSLLAWGADVPVDASVTDGGLLRAVDPFAWGLPHADGSVDIVALPDGEAARDAGVLAEARRVAVRSVVRLAPVARSDDRPPTTLPVAAVERLDADAAGARPSVSVVIPTYNDATMLATCLRTLWETVPAGLDVEVIVSDDGSAAPFPAQVAALVARYPGTRLVANPVNGGYIAAISAGVAEARHDIVITLNNDTLLLPGWLEPLVDMLAVDPSVGIVGGRLVYPDGRLQEAGCVIFRDASATKVGYGDDDPERDFYQHPRPVDYVSGALLAIPRDLLTELGGLDRAYGFGYYEDGDLCFRVRAAGRRVMYQPASTIVHVEGGTAGLDVTSGAKAYQARNQRLFADRWAAVLAHHPVRPVNLDLRTSRLLAVSERPWMATEPTGEVAA